MTNRVRLMFVVACLVLGGWLILRSRVEGGVMFVAAALFLWGMFRYSTVWSAFRAMRNEDFSRARSLIAQVKHPARLAPQSGAYYDWIVGALAAQDHDYSKARESLEAAAAGSIRTSNDHAAVQCALAEVAIAQGDPSSARGYLARAYEFPHHPQLDLILLELEERMRASDGG